MVVVYPGELASKDIIWPSQKVPEVFNVPSVLTTFGLHCAYPMILDEIKINENKYLVNTDFGIEIFIMRMLI
jgi:hypothetical protein